MTKNFVTINLPATGENIKNLRMKSQLSVRDLQEYFGFEYPQPIYKWQWGQCLPTVDNLVGLSMLFQISINEILVTNGEDFIIICCCRYSLF